MVLFSITLLSWPWRAPLRLLIPYPLLSHTTKKPVPSTFTAMFLVLSSCHTFPKSRSRDHAQAPNRHNLEVSGRLDSVRALKGGRQGD